MRYSDVCTFTFQLTLSGLARTERILAFSRLAHGLKLIVWMRHLKRVRALCVCSYIVKLPVYCETASLEISRLRVHLEFENLKIMNTSKKHFITAPSPPVLPAFNQKGIKFITVKQRVAATHNVLTTYNKSLISIISRTFG